VVKRINNALMRQDQIQTMEGKGDIDWFAPVVADAESGFGGVLNAFELMKAMIDAGAAGVHFEDQLASVKKCGHMGGKVLGADAGRGAEADRGAPRGRRDGRADVLLARTDAEAPTSSPPTSTRTTSRSSPASAPRKASTRRRKGFDQALSRGLAYAEYADMVWCETGTPDLAFARKFAEGIRKKFPGKMLAYNCSPSFNWKRNLDDASIAKFQRELGAMGYKFQFITLAGFHSLNYSMFELRYGYARDNMSAFVALQEKEFAAAEKGFTAVKHQREVGTGYFDQITQVCTRRQGLPPPALHGSTEDEQFFGRVTEARKSLTPMGRRSVLRTGRPASASATADQQYLQSARSAPAARGPRCPSGGTKRRIGRRKRRVIASYSGATGEYGIHPGQHRLTISANTRMLAA
jgi:isocitrate lyase